MKINEETKLKKDALSFWHLVFYAVVIMFPASAFVITGSTAMVYAGPVAPLAFLIAGAILFLAIIAVYFYTTKVANAGGYYKFVEVSIPNKYLSKSVGLLQILYYISTMWFVSILSGWLFWVSLETMFSISVPIYLVIIISLIGPIAFLFIGYRTITVSGNLAIIVGTTEMIIFGIIAIMLIIKSPYNGVQYFNILNSWNGFSGFFTAVIVGGFLSYSGYGSIVSYGEEAKMPHNTLKKAIVTAALIIILYETFVVYSVVSAAGPTLSTGLQFFAPGFYYTKQYFGIGMVLVAFIVILFDQIMAPVFNGNQAARIMFALSRDKVLPASLSKVHQKFKSPYMAVVTVSIITIIGVIFLILSLVYIYGINDGLFYAWLIPGTILSLIWMIYHIIVNQTLAVLMHRIKEFKIITHLIGPTIASVFLIIAAYYSFIGLSWPVSIVFILIPIWIVGSLIYIYSIRKKVEMEQLIVKT
jgi:amino acid transporter